MVLAVLLLMAGAGVAGYLAGRTVTDAPVGFVVGDADTIAELEAVADDQREQIRRLQERLSDIPSPAPSQERLLTALDFCHQAFTLLIDREAALFADSGAVNRFVQLSNRCLAPLERQLEVPS